MRAICKRETLIKNIGVVQRAVSSRSTLPILNNIFLETKDGRMRAVATDLEIGIETQFEVNVLEEGTITVPAKYLLEIIRRLPSEEIEIAVEKGSQIHITSDKAHFTISGLPAEEFPALPEIKDGQKLLIAPKDLRRLIEETSFVCSKDETTRPELSGILLIVLPEKMQAVGTDGSRLALVEIEGVTGQSAKQEVLIPGRALEEVLRIMGEGDGEGMDVLVGPNLVEFHLPSKKLVTRTIQSKRCSLLARLVSHRLQLTSRETKILLKVTVPEVGSAEEELEWAQGTGDMDVSINCRYLIEGLRNIKTEHAFFGFTGKDRPIVIKPSDEKGYLYLAMPLRI
ncbi:MAG: DNA polymerase III subunit beta [Coprothermobacterota bacterium]|nr:DNA polymerase III subunit beta [Coprothermobacterota bacterium]